MAAMILGIPLETDEGNETTLAVCLNVKVWDSGRENTQLL